MPKNDGKIVKKDSMGSQGSQSSQDSTDSADSAAKAERLVRQNRGTVVAVNMEKIVDGMQARNKSKVRMDAIADTEKARIKKIEGYYAQEEKDAAWRSAQKPAQPVVAKQAKKGRPESIKPKVGGREALDEIIKLEEAKRAAAAAKIAAAKTEGKPEASKKSWRPW